MNRNIPYAKHAISIDENRKEFARVRWGVPDDRPSRDEFGNLTFEQVWFAGNHADIGGGYKDNESRLSDTALKWMLACAYTIPYGIRYERTVLRLHPDPAGIRHDEVKSGFGTISNFFGITWTYGTRKLPNMDNSEFSDATMHRSVYERFDMEEVPDYDAMREYRPVILENHIDFKDAYGKAGAKSNAQRAAVAAYVEDCLPPNA
jgi:T6SS, Phospholipase effector Tle1-like, catalytic domain